MQTVGDIAFFGEDTRTLAQVQADALASIQAAKRNALAAMPYTIAGVTYAVTLTAQDIIDCQMKLQWLAAQPAGTTIGWEIIDSVFLTFALADLEALFNNGQAYMGSVYPAAQALTAQVNAATTIAAVQAIDLTQGWPPGYSVTLSTGGAA